MSAAPQSLRIAMWSGPRNISTAMMRAWENRTDTVVWDEPFYAHYLVETGLDHPGRDQIIAAGDADWRSVVNRLTGSVPGGKAIFYQKHMTHHLLPHIGREWLDQVANCFLIRDPREVVLSYSKTRSSITPEDVGFPQQVEIFEHVRARTRRIPLVIDAADFLKDPRGMLGLICKHLEVPFDSRMLSWPPGPRSSDGIWGQYWYASVWASTGFSPYRPRTVGLPVHLERLVEICTPLYRQLFEHRLHG
jgi:hypothetical protein